MLYLLRLGAAIGRLDDGNALFLFTLHTITFMSSPTGIPAIIVIRHAMDDGNQKPDGPLTYDAASVELIKNDQPSPNNEVAIWRDFLCPNQGYKAACRLKANLQQHIEQMGLAAVNQVLSILPDASNHNGPTPNPLVTITPYVNATAPNTLAVTGSKLKLRLYSSSKCNPERFDADQLLADGYSKVICWERNGMWERPEEGQPPAQAILNQLIDPSAMMHALEHEPAKGVSIYVFSGREAAGKYGVQRVDNLDPNMVACGGEHQAVCTRERCQRLHIIEGW